MTFGVILKNLVLSKNCCDYFLGKLLETFGPLFIPTSGHTDEEDSRDSPMGPFPKLELNPQFDIPPAAFTFPRLE